MPTSVLPILVGITTPSVAQVGKTFISQIAGSIYATPIVSFSPVPAREMVIFIPSGEETDPTRASEFYDSTFDYLSGIGIPVLPG